MSAKSAALVGSMLLVVTPAKAICVFGVGSACPITDESAGASLRPLVNGKLVGRFTVKQSILFDTLRFGQTGPKSEDNAFILSRTERIRAYLNEKADCLALGPLWTGDAVSDQEKKNFCDLAQTMRSHGLSAIETIIGPIQVNKSGLTKAIHLQLALTESGRAHVERFLLSRGANSFAVATGALNFLRILGRSGEVQNTTVKFQYEVVPNVWAHVEKGLTKRTLRPKRETGEATFRKESNHWQLVGEPNFVHAKAPLILPVGKRSFGRSRWLPIWSWMPQ